MGCAVAGLLGALLTWLILGPWVDMGLAVKKFIFALSYFNSIV